MIELVLGLPGSGKSLYMLWLMGQYVTQGAQVATNMILTPSCPFQKHVVQLDGPPFTDVKANGGETFQVSQYPVFQMPIEHWEDKRKTTIYPYKAFWHYMPPQWVYFIDEADNYFDSMDFTALKNVGDDCRLYYKQHRKREDVLILSVQNLDNIWNRIRRMVQKFIVCENTRRSMRIMSYLPISWSRFVRAEYGHESLREESLLGSGYFSYSEAQRMFSWYRTDQLVGGAWRYKWGGVN